MSANELSTSELCEHCDLKQFPFETTDELELLEEIVGQPRAVEAVQFGIDIQREGYNIFVLGEAGTGKLTLVTQYLEKKVHDGKTPDDWCYVNNFEEPHKPNALRLPAGKGKKLQEQMEQLIEEVQGALSEAFEGEEYQNRKQAVQKNFADVQRKAMEEFEAKAKKRGLGVVRSPMGLGLVPLDEEGKKMEPKQVQNLSEEKKKELEKRGEDLQQEAQQLLQQAPRAQREVGRREKNLGREIAERAIEPLVAELRNEYDQPRLHQYFDAVRKDIVENHEEILKLHQKKEERQPGEPGELMTPQPVPTSMLRSSVLRKYMVNLLVEHRPDEGRPLVYEDHPTLPKVTGRVDYLAQMGALVADFNMIKPGALHCANGGYLVLEMHKLLVQPFVWETLKRAIRAREVRVESPGESLGLIRTATLEPEPIPLEVKVVLMGSPLMYQVLRDLDPEFAELFKVPADFGVQMDRDDGNQQIYARLIGTLAKKESLAPFERAAVARVIEHSSRLTGDAKKLSVHMRSVVDLLREADYWAGQNGDGRVKGKDVERAIRAQEHRYDRLRERIHEEIQRGTLLIDTEGSRTGQVNGLAVFPSGDFLFGRPCRITARARVGNGELIDIEREVALGGPIHSKGVLILAGFLSGRYAQRLPLSLSASLVFEQSYSGIGGDSASLAELFALLSSIADVPLKQSLAVTGSVNQHGRVQAVGGVNQKIEGFFDVCRDRGLTGGQGVLIPEANRQHLMLRRDVIEAVEAGKFHIYALQTVNDGITLLADVPAGEPDSDGNYPADSFNGRVNARLEEFARQRQQYMAATKGSGER